jgi:hypothetical protein
MSARIVQNFANVAKQAKAVLNVEKLEAVTDRGYFDGVEILACRLASSTERRLQKTRDRALAAAAHKHQFLMS